MKAFLKSKKWRVAALVCLVAVAVTVSGTFAWYITSRRTDAALQVITSEEGSAIVCGQYTVYLKTTDASGNPVYQVFNALDEKVTLKEFDSVFGENEDTAIIMKIPVSGTSLNNGSNLLLTLSRANRGVLEGYSDANGLFSNATNEADKVEKDKILRYLTNIASFRFSLIPALNGVTDPGTIYETAKTEFSKSAEVQFASASWIQDQKTYTVTKDTNQLIWDIPAADISSAVSEGVLNLYVEIDYDKTLIAAYLQDHSTNFVARKLGVTEMLEFIGDLAKAEIAVQS